MRKGERERGGGGGGKGRGRKRRLFVYGSRNCIASRSFRLLSVRIMRRMQIRAYGKPTVHSLRQLALVLVDDRREFTGVSRFRSSEKVIVCVFAVTSNRGMKRESERTRERQKRVRERTRKFQRDLTFFRYKI